MVYEMGESSQTMSSSTSGSTESIGAIVLISIGSIFVILCAAAIVYGLRRRRHVTSTGILSLTEKRVQNPTDFMHSLATWDRNQPIEEMLEKRRRSAWTLEIFENYNSSEGKTKLHSET